MIPFQSYLNIKICNLELDYCTALVIRPSSNYDDATYTLKVCILFPLVFIFTLLTYGKGKVVARAKLMVISNLL